MGCIKKLIGALLLLFMFIDNSNAQDWANLQRFQEANAQLPAPQKGEKRVVFMGNSITEGWLNARPEYFKNKPFVNRGISGQTTPQMLLRFRQDVVALKPAVVVILAGTNDIAGNTGPATLEEIYGNIRSMVDIAQANGIQVLLCSVLPATDFPWRSGPSPSVKIVKLNAMIKVYAREAGIAYVDYFSAVANTQNGMKEELSEDGVHPNGAGYAMMEPVLDAVLANVSQ